MTLSRIFVSHSPKDEGIARRLVKHLQDAGGDVWVDWDSASLSPDEFRQHIDKELSQSDWLVLVLSPDAIASRWIRTEVDAALLRVNQGSMQAVILFLVAPCAPGTIPPQWEALRLYDATHDYARALTRLLRHLGLAPTVQVEQFWREPPPPGATYDVPAPARLHSRPPVYAPSPPP